MSYIVVHTAGQQGRQAAWLSKQVSPSYVLGRPGEQKAKRGWLRGWLACRSAHPHLSQNGRCWPSRWASGAEDVKDMDSDISAEPIVS